MSKARDLANAGTALTTVSATELGYLDGVTSAVQTQVDAKIAKTLTTTTGDIIYASSANTPARLGIGSTDQVLKVTGGVPVWATPSSGALVLIATASPSAASAVNINNCFTSTYQNYYIVYNLIGSVGSNLSLRLRASAADRTTSNYSYYGTSTNATPSNGGWYNANGTKWDLNDISTTRTTGILTVFNPQETSFTTILSQSYKAQGTSRHVVLGGDYNVSSTNDGFTLFPDSGTFTGTVRVYGIANN